MEKDNNVLDIRRFWRAVRSLKWIYLAVTILCLSAAGWYLNRSLDKVPIMGQMLVGEESMDNASGAAALPGAASAAGGMAQMMKTFSVGGFGASAVDNEVLIISSHDVLKRTVKALNLNRQYVGRDEEGKSAMLYRNSPVIVEAPAEYFDSLSTTLNMKVKLLAGGKADIKVTKGFFKKVLAEATGVTLPTLIKTPLGNLQVLRSECFDSSPFRELKITITGNNIAAINLDSQVKIDVATKLSDVVNVELDYPNAELGKAIVNGIMTEYNAKRLDRIHETAQNTVNYYDERIAETLSRLEKAEQKVADYQKENTLISPASELPMLTRQGYEQQQQAILAQNNLDYARKVLSTLRGNMHDDILIPQIESLGDTTIKSYNRLILERRDLERSARPDNKALILLNEKISTTRDLIIENAEKTITKAQSDIAFQQGLAGGAKSQISKVPGLELELTVLARDQTFQTSLYQFLAQARENAVLKLYTETAVAFVFQPAYVQKAGLPIKAIAIVLGALIFALISVTCVALIVMWCSRKVRQPMDVAFLGFDNHTVCSSTPEAAARMRTILMSPPSPHIIYTASFASSSSQINDVVNSFRETGLNIAQLTADTNALLLSPEMNDAIAAALESADYVFVSVPEPDKIFAVENAVDADGAALLIEIPSSLTRKKLKSLLKGQTVDRIYAIISGK